MAQDKTHRGDAESAEERGREAKAVRSFGPQELVDPEAIHPVPSTFLRVSAVRFRS
jgi:hypothetical protein